MSGWMLGPIALESMLIQVNTVASTCIVFCRLHAMKTGQSKDTAPAPKMEVYSRHFLPKSNKKTAFFQHLSQDFKAFPRQG